MYSQVGYCRARLRSVGNKPQLRPKTSVLYLDMSRCRSTISLVNIKPYKRTCMISRFNNLYSPLHSPSFSLTLSLSLSLSLSPLPLLGLFLTWGDLSASVPIFVGAVFSPPCLNVTPSSKTMWRRRKREGGAPGAGAAGEGRGELVKRATKFGKIKH